MPKHEISLAPGERLNPEVETLLFKYFPTKKIDILREKGGKITISVSYPRTRPKTIQDIDQRYIDYIRNFRGSEKELFARLESISARQLRQICNALGIPTRSKATIDELLHTIISFVKSSDKWREIAGNPINE